MAMKDSLGLNNAKPALSMHPGGLELTGYGARVCGMSAGDTVLDIGCGTGASLRYLADKLGIVPYGVDSSEKAVGIAAANCPGGCITAADAASLPFPAGYFDHVIIECVLTLLDDPGSAINEAIRVLKPGGSLMISTLTSEAAAAALENTGLITVLSEDRKGDLTQYVIDSIMEYGSLAGRISAETELAGGSVFDCDAEYDRKTVSYHLYVFRKPVGTPVDALVAERLGVDPLHLTQEAVEEYQLQAFRRTMRHAMISGSFYRKLLAGLDPDEIRTMEDIRRIPSTSESDLAGNEWQFQCMPASDIDRAVTVPALEHKDTVTLPTSGTSGRSKRIVFTAEDQEKSVAFINRGFLTQRCYKGERMLVFMSGTTEGSIGDLVMRAMAPLEMDIRVHGAVTGIADAYDALMDFRPGVVEALPWHAAALARYGTRFGNPERDFIRTVNLSADVVPDSIVHRLEKLWECTVHRHYGTTEMAIFGGVECEYHQGYHTRPCDILYEIPETDESGYGEMLITTLDRKAMPLIRYRTGDIARFIDTPCPCGCRIRRIERFLGRRSSLIEFAGGSLYLSELADALYSIPQVIDFDVTLREGSDAYLRQYSASPYTPELELTVRTLPGDSLDTEIVRSHLAKLVRKIIINIESTDSFPGGYNLKKKVIRT